MTAYLSVYPWCFNWLASWCVVKFFNDDDANVNVVFVCVWYSWASGSNPWGPERDDQFMRPTHYDGMLEVVGVTGVVHMGQIQSGLRSAMRIAQGGHVRYLLLIRLINIRKKI